MNALHFRLATLALLVIFFAGCGGGSRYRVDERPANERIPVRVAVTDFSDRRPTETRTVSMSRAAPLTFYNSWRFSRPDEVYSGHVETFPRLIARSLANALEEGNFVESAQYYEPDNLPPPGEFDILVRGILHDTTARGNTYFYSLVFPLGFQLSDVLWYLGAPKFTRRYDLDIELRLINGYTNEPMGAPFRITDTTSSKIFGQYANERRLQDLQRKIHASWNTFIATADDRLPDANAADWAELRTSGEQFLAQQAFEQERIRRGAPPVFTFISPPNNSQIRNPTVDLQWSATAPNGLRELELALNGEPIDSGYAAPDLSDERSAPRSVPAQQVTIPIPLGRSTITAVVRDHRENETPADLQLMRLPRRLTPETRFALVIGAGTPEVQTSARMLSEAFRDPMVGQFRSADTQTLTADSLSSEDIRRAVSTFSARPQSGELAVIYIAAPALAESGAIGTAADSLPIAEFVNRKSVV